ncbi:hypothetical protein D9M68_753770 [compost metagenome]
MRAIRSVEPPAANGTTRRTGLAGQAGSAWLKGLASSREQHKGRLVSKVMKCFRRGIIRISVGTRPVRTGGDSCAGWLEQCCCSVVFYANDCASVAAMVRTEAG